MNENTVSQKHMEALQALAKATMDISEANNTLRKIREEETEYLVSREKKALVRIQEVLDISHNLVEETNKNYESIQELAKTITEGAELLASATDSFFSLIETKDNKFKEWENAVKNQEETVVSLRNGLKVEATAIESAKSQVQKDKDELLKERRKLDDERGTLDRAIERLKNNRT